MEEELIEDIKNDNSINTILDHYLNDINNIKIIKELTLLQINIEYYNYNLINLDLICKINKLIDLIEIKHFKLILKNLRKKFIILYQNF